MTEVPDWDHDTPFETWRPSPAEEARSLELWQMALNDDPRFGEVFDGFIADVLTERNLPSVLVAILRAGRDILEGNCGDRKLMHARLAADTVRARDDAIKEVIYRDGT